MVTLHSADFVVNMFTGDSTIGRRIWHLSMPIPKTKVSTVSWYTHSLLARCQVTQTWAIIKSTTDLNLLRRLTMHDTVDDVHPKVEPRYCHSVDCADFADH